ncbi:MAG: hypothetical protein J0I34_29040 [Pseudonocardia sp.]|uniref:glycine-rich domain-containing protein n=1 Tax=Pseudonocardia sp. TaxID=60912 RepID=UPI000B31E7E8|nr:hypothetical protein [Pseudonocardia sp.]MBN9112820.1 hypothetical protein [Pseudonocardia sp.]
MSAALRVAAVTASVILAAAGLETSTASAATLLMPQPVTPTAQTSAPCDLASSTSCTYTGSGELPTVTIPSGVSRLTAIVTGSQGGTPRGHDPDGGEGGGAGQVIAQLDVHAGQQLQLWIGRRDPQAGYTHGGGGATSSSSQGGASGGGSSAIVSDKKPLVVAGGGGGGGGGGATTTIVRAGSGGSGGSGGKPAQNGRQGNGSYSGGKSPYKCSGGSGGSGEKARSGKGESAIANFVLGGGGGGGGGGGYPHGGTAGYSGDGTLTCGGGGGGGGGESFVGNGARLLAFNGVASNGDGSIVLSTHLTAAVFHCKHGKETWRVPATVTSVDAIVVGAAGGIPTDPGVSGRPGYGARVAATIAAPADSDLTVTVGCDGNSGAGYGDAHGGGRGIAHTFTGFNGGGGGGASSITDAAGTRLVVAGGGGGGGGSTYFAPQARGGNGGSAGHGPGRAGAHGGSRGQGIYGHGGDGAHESTPRGADGEDSAKPPLLGGGGGGGGGGGYAHGGGRGESDSFGGGGGGGGAGDSYADSARTRGATFEPGADGGNGVVILLYTP